MRVHVFLPVLFFLAAHALPAQIVLKTHHDTSARASGKVNVRLINPNGKQVVNYEGKSFHTDSVQQAIKLNPFLISRGEFIAYYEYRLSDPFSVEAAAGITYVDYMYEIVQNEGRFLTRDNEGANVRFLSGFSGHAQFRWYPSHYETAITGFYLAPDFSHRDWKMDYYVNTGLIREPHHIRRTWNEFKLQVGYQDADPYENIFWEWFVAAGVRYADEDYVDGSGINADFAHDKYVKAVIGAGIKIGFTL